MPQEFPNARWKWTPLFATGGALGVAAVLFLLIPLTQILDEVKKPDLLVREVAIAPPPPDVPPPPEEAMPPKPETPPPEMPQEPPPIQVNTLDVALNPGAGDAIAIGVETPQLQTEDMTSSIQQLFTFEDLPEAPRLINQPRFRYPPELARRGVEQGKVVVEIDILPNGRARLRRIVSSTHPALEPAAREVVERARFTKPVIDGRARTVRGRFPIILQN